MIKWHDASVNVPLIVFEAYAENETPAAYRLFWYYGPEEKEITIYSITPSQVVTVAGRCSI